jgi:hypothetical protein
MFASTGISSVILTAQGLRCGGGRVGRHGDGLHLSMSRLLRLWFKRLEQDLQMFHMQYDSHQKVCWLSLLI